MKLKNAVIFITGSAKRVGRAMVLDFAARGAKVIVHYHSSSKEAGKLKHQVEKKWKTSLGLVQGDLSQTDEIKRIGQEAWDCFGKIDVLINNASTFYPTPLGKVKDEQWEDLFRVNAKAPFFLSQILGKKMKQRGKGKIINIGDWAAHHPYQGYIPYCASKAALLAVSEGLAKSLAPEVQVNAVLPGPILWKDQDEKTRRDVVKKTPLKRTGKPEDVVSAVRFFIEGNDFMTGSELHVDGGRSIY